MKKGPLPLVVGVTGHRDLVADDGPRIASNIRGLFADLRKRYPHTPLVLMSSLAEGADRLVAQTALECGADLYAVLPMNAESYEHDFASVQSRDEFRRLMARSYNNTVVESRGGEGAIAAIDGGIDRDRRYALSGAFLVSYSQIVVALWDGDRDELVGGTSQIVRFALQGVPAQFSSGPSEPLHLGDTGAVYHVPVERVGKANGAAAVPAGWLFPRSDAVERSKRAQTAFERNLLSLERFNRDAALSGNRSAQSSTAARLLPRAGDAPVIPPDSVLEYVGSLFENADALALRCRNGTHGALIGIFCAIGAAAVLFSVYTNLLPKLTPLYVAFLTMVAVAFAIDIAVKRANLQDRFQDYRALAEGLRVQFYWQLARVRESVYDHYLAHQEGELDWIRNAMRAARLQDRGESADLAESERQQLLELVLDRWVSTEGRYFSQAALTERRKATRLRWAANACLAVTGVVAIALSTAVAQHWSDVFAPLVTALTLTLTGAALITGYSQKRAHDEHARRYDRMRDLYAIATDRLGTLLRERDVAGAKAVLLQLGREALSETCDWLLLHRDRQIDVPTG